MKNQFITLLILVLPCSFIYAQLNDHELAELLQSRDLVILNEENELAFQAKKIDFIEVEIHKDVTYQILKESGNQKINPVVLPEPLDEIYHSHNSKILKGRRLFDQVYVNSFDAWLVNPDGSETAIDFNLSKKENQVVARKEQFGVVYDYRYSFPKFSAGDIVHLKYSYTFPFISNWQKLLSARIFLETCVPTKKIKFTLSHHNNLVMELHHFNVDDPYSYEENNRTYHQWTLTNQSGCIDEPGAWPHEESPYFTICPKPYELLYEHYNSFQEEFPPMWYLLASGRELKIRKAFVDDHLGVKNKDNHCFERVARRYVKMLPDDSTGIGRLRYFQRFVVDSIRYDDAYSLYNWDEINRKRSPGCDLASGFIREPNKEFVYANILPKLGCKYFTAYIDDARSGLISKEYLAPLYDNEMMFAALTGDVATLILPKTDKRNLYCEELPFYYESTPVLLISTYDFAGHRRNYNDAFRLIVTPGSTAKDNYRKVNSMAKYDAENAEIVFRTRISLSGQYSTLTYPVYNDDPTDESINPKYLEKIWDLAEETELNQVQPKGKKCFFPFVSCVEAEYSAGIEKDDEGMLHLDIGSWLKHVYYDDMDADHRFTSYHADFLGSDSFSYMIVFDQPVKMISAPDTLKIDNDFGTYQFDITKTDANKILVTSFLLTKSLVVEPSEITAVAGIFDAIEQTSHSELVVRLIEE